MLINYFGEGICFTYPNNRKKTQMFFSTSFRARKMAKSLRRKTDDDVIIACAKILQMKSVTHANLTYVTAAVMQTI